MQISEILHASKLPFLEAEVLLSFALGVSKEFLFTHSSQKVSKQDLHEFQNLEKQRRDGVSIAKLIGRKEFFSLEFEVSGDTLIPRPESEMLVEEALKLKPKSLLDVGTGSGCIAISIKKNLPGCAVWGCDISKVALKLAKRNAQKHEVEVKIIESDLLSKVERGFEVIVANLPYIPKDSKEVEKGVRKHESPIALFGGADGLDAIRKLLTQISKLSHKPKFVLLEFGGFAQTKILKKFVKDLFPKAKLTILKDLRNIDRVIRLENE